MTYRRDLLVPWGYGSTRQTLAWVEQRLQPLYHPEALDRFLHWLDSEDGKIGPGSTFRASQPIGPGYAPAGKSFHERQRFSDGVSAASAIDVVKYAGPGRSHLTVSWSDVPYRGTPKSVRWGLHANVGMPGDPFPRGEPWHVQLIEVFGWQSWVNAGSPAPKKGYLLSVKPPPSPAPPPGAAKSYVVQPGDGWWKIATALGMPTTQQSFDQLRQQLLVAVGRDVPWPGDTLTCCTGDAPIPPPPPPSQHPNPDTMTLPSHTPMIRRGDTGDRVTWLQVMLHVKPDGIFGSQTEQWLRTHQANLGVTVDGVYGPQTALAWEAWRSNLGLPRTA